MKRERGNRRIVLYLLSVLLCTGLCGCAGSSAEGGTEVQPVQAVPEEISYQLLDEAQLDYQVPEQYPGVLVSLGGYESKGNKEVYFCGRSLPDTFRLMDAATGQCVYTGHLEKKRYNQDTEEYNGYGEFTDFIDVGEYYIECDVIGRSYSFAIREGLLQEQFDLALMEIRSQGLTVQAQQGTQEIRELLQQVMLVLLSYELYPGVYEDGDGNQIPDILEYMTETVGRLVQLQQSAEPDELTYERIAALAKYSYLYQKYDNPYATEIIQLAAGLWQQAENAGEDSGALLDRDARLFAAAELYRATGQRKYAAEVEAAEGGLLWKKEQGVFQPYDYLAAETYISTKQKVNTELCSSLMRILMNYAEDVAAGIPRTTIQEADLSAEDMDSMMWDMAVLSVVEYIITNYEYGSLVESQYYFLWGRNEKSHCFREQEISGHPAWMACYLLMLSEMRTNG